MTMLSLDSVLPAEGTVSPKIANGVEKIRRLVARLAIITTVPGGAGTEKKEIYSKLFDEGNMEMGLDQNNPLVLDYLMLLETINGTPIAQARLNGGINTSLTTLLILNGYKLVFYRPQYGNIPNIGITQLS